MQGKAHCTACRIHGVECKAANWKPFKLTWQVRMAGGLVNVDRQRAATAARTAKGAAAAAGRWLVGGCDAALELLQQAELALRLALRSHLAAAVEGQGGRQLHCKLSRGHRPQRVCRCRGTQPIAALACSLAAAAAMAAAAPQSAAVVAAGTQRRGWVGRQRQLAGHRQLWRRRVGHRREGQLPLRRCAAQGGQAGGCRRALLNQQAQLVAGAGCAQARRRLRRCGLSLAGALQDSASGVVVG